MRLPSGEKRGSASGPSLFVSCFAFLPSAVMLQIFIVPERSLTKTIVPLRRATSSLPGGDEILGTGFSFFLSGSGAILGLTAVTVFLVPSLLRARRKP